MVRPALPANVFYAVKVFDTARRWHFAKESVSVRGGLPPQTQPVLLSKRGLAQSLKTAYAPKKATTCKVKLVVV